MNEYSTNPKITYAAIKLEDLLDALASSPDPEYEDILAHRDETLQRYQQVFSPEHLPGLTSGEFTGFLNPKNNHHWNGLQRIGGHMVKDMELLREALGILLDESAPVEERINQIRPERYWGTNSMVSHLGMPVLSAILFIVYPHKYGVWNKASDLGLKAVRLWEKEWGTQPTGRSYCEMNAIYLELCSILDVDLWALDALWWVVKKAPKRG